MISRRHFNFADLAMLSFPFQSFFANTRSKENAMADEIQTYERAIDIASLKKKWPDGHELPPLIESIATLIKSNIWGSVGYFEMSGSRFDDYWIEGGSDSWADFGMFLKFADGTKVAQWFHEGAVPGAEPIVEIGSEGDLNIIAPNLKSFMRDWASDKGYRDLTIFEEDRTPERLALWKVVADKMHALLDATPEPPASAPADNIASFIEKFSKASRAQMAMDPVLREIATLMAAHIPHGKAEYEYYNAQIFIAGSRIEILPNALPPDYTERAALPEHEALIPLIIKAREARAQGGHAVRGLWHSASLRISPDGFVQIPADWDEEPKFEHGGRVKKSELETDLLRYPRSERWCTTWMDELI
jgi:hypothetical protein